jgi:hypothetical protein
MENSVHLMLSKNKSIKYFISIGEGDSGVAYISMMPYRRIS